MRPAHLEPRFKARVRSSRSFGPGFTLIEILIAITLLGIMTAVASSRLTSMTRSQRVDRVGAIIAGDVRTAFSAAARGRVPVRIGFAFANRSYAITNRVTGDTIIRRDLSSGDLRLSSMSGTSAVVDVFPVGVAGVVDTIVFGDPTQYHKRVTISRVGAVRVIR